MHSIFFLSIHLVNALEIGIDGVREIYDYLGFITHLSSENSEVWIRGLFLNVQQRVSLAHCDTSVETHRTERVRIHHLLNEGSGLTHASIFLFPSSSTSSAPPPRKAKQQPGVSLCSKACRPPRAWPPPAPPTPGSASASG